MLFVKFICHVTVVVTDHKLMCNYSENEAGPFPTRYGQAPSDQQQVQLPRRRWMPEVEQPAGSKRAAQSDQQVLTSLPPTSRPSQLAGQLPGRLDQLTGQHQIGVEPESEQRAHRRLWDLWRSRRSSTPRALESAQKERTGGEKEADGSSRRAGEESGAAAGERGKETVQPSSIQSTTSSVEEEQQKRRAEEEGKESERGKDEGSVRAEDKPAGRKNDTEKPADEKADQPAGKTKDADGGAGDAEEKEDELEGHSPAKNEVFLYRVMLKNRFDFEIMLLEFGQNVVTDFSVYSHYLVHLLP